LNLLLGLDNYSYKFDGITVTDSMGFPHHSPDLAVIIGHAPNGLPNEWLLTATDGRTLHVQATLTPGGDYATFRFDFQPFPVDPIFLVFWDFTAAAVLAGVDLTNPAPTFFQPKIAGDHWNFVFELAILPVLM